ncbi:hypothetical protein PHAVU_005G136300 [Phaseolus vulgaris]|uniref:protein indeterminate-domain 7-like isoform X1 n=1 Tax=Phaseolus vulgaris TaxID=3885 RepID=UPI0035C99598
MMSGEAITVPSNLGDSSVQVHDPNSNPNPNPNPNSSVKRKRSLPGTPADPNAEVIALSPKSLMATNRFICEVCNKGFQRDQNLQLHRRGHNLPWKLRQRTKEEVRKKVYVCPEKSCVHHDPCRALGDLTGIKKHFSRKHGEKKWKCEKCSKKYAVQSDWKAHNKICGTRQYKCDCGTIFSRKDSFVTHRAFCDAMVEQSTRLPAVLSNHLGNDILMNAQGPRVMPQGLQLHGFHSEFGGPGPESYMGNFADAEHVEHKLRLPLWLDQTNLQLNHPLGVVPGNSSVFSPGATLPETNNIFGTSSSQAQWANYRYPEASFACASVSMPHGLKLEQEDNKGELSHCVSSLYPSHMESTRMSGTSPFDNSNFGLLDPNMSSTSTNNRSNVVEIQKLFKQGNQPENLNLMVNSQASRGGFSLSCRKSLEHMVMPRIEEWGSGEAEITEKQVRSSSNTEEHLTKDFMGVGDGSLSRQMGPVMNLQRQFRGHY